MCYNCTPLYTIVQCHGYNRLVDNYEINVVKALCAIKEQNKNCVFKLLEFLQNGFQ
jgi:hypothetical protein